MLLMHYRWETHVSPSDCEVGKPLSPIGEIWETKTIIYASICMPKDDYTLYLMDIIGSNTSLSLAIMLGVLQLSKVLNLWAL